MSIGYYARNAVFGAVFILSMMGCYNSPSQCDKLKTQVPRVQKILEKWVDQNVRPDVLTSHVRHAGGGGPGDYWITLPFPWASIGFEDASRDNQIRLICDTNDQPIAVFFGEGGRHGYLVSVTADFSKAGAYSQAIVHQVGRTAVYCDERNARRSDGVRAADPKGSG